MFVAKLELIKQFLAFVSSFAPAPGMRLATLGGEGLEAALWQEIGIAPNDGWLIECVQKRSRRLMARFPYRHCTRLEHFSRSAEAVWGRAYGIDGFHLDLCGTYERGGAAFASVIPLIMRGRGRCLAVTVADQRRNPSLECFDEVFTNAFSAFGGEARARAFLEKLTRDYEALPEYGVGLYADPVNGAEREFAFAGLLLSTLDRKGALPIDRIERYLYISSSKGRPFRMRSYFFHFADAAAPHDALDLWSGTPLQQVSEHGFTTIQPVTQKEPDKMTYPNLRKLAEAAGATCLSEFNSLIADAVYGRQIRAIPYGNGAAHAEQITVAPSASTTSKRSAAAASSPAITKRLASLEAQLDLLRSNAKGKRAFKAAEKRVIKALNLGTENKRAVGGVLARTQGGFRPGFLKGLVAAGMFTDALVQELVQLYGAYGVEVTAEELRKEAEAT